MGTILDYTKNLIGSILALSVTAILCDAAFSPPEWGIAMTSLLIGVMAYMYLSLSDDIKKLVTPDAR